MNAFPTRPTLSPVLRLPSRLDRLGATLQPGADSAPKAGINRPVEQADYPVPAAPAPSGGDSVAATELRLAEAWGKVFRARELFEEELRALREQQAALHSLRAELDRRESSLAALDRTLSLRQGHLTAREEAYAHASRQALDMNWGQRIKRLFGANAG